MKKLILTAAVIAMSFASVAQADIAAPVWTCKISAERVSGANIGILLSAGGLETGNATITCEQPGEAPVVKKAAIIMSQIGVGLGFTFFRSFELRSVVVGLANANDLFGKYKIGVKAGVNLFEVEGGVLIQTRLNQGLTFELGLYGSNAFGLAANAQAVFIEILTPKQYQKLLKQREEDQRRIHDGNLH